MTFEKIKKDKAFKRLPRTGFKIRKPPRPQAPDATDPEYDRLKRLLNDEQLVKRVIKLQQKFPQGTLPELIFYDWLQRNGYNFLYQVEMFGGRRKIGGVVVDFLVITGQAEGLAIGVDGTYWHSIAVAGLKDETYRIRIVGQTFQGYRIYKYVRMDEQHVYFRRPQVFTLAIAGIEMDS